MERVHIVVQYAIRAARVEALLELPALSIPHLTKLVSQVVQQAQEFLIMVLHLIAHLILH